MDREALGGILFRHREALPVLLSVPVIAAALRGGGTPRAGALLGSAVVGGGVLLRLGAVRRIGRGARVFRAHASGGLISAGPYCWTRNPLYIAAALMLCGFGLVAGAGWIAVALVPATLLAYTPVVLVEEHALVALFGDAYRSYLAHVPRWIGFKRPYRGMSRGALVGWREVFRREKGLVPWSIIALLAIATARGEWLPASRVSHRLLPASELGRETAVAGTAAIAVIANAVKVELHERRRLAGRAARVASSGERRGG
ncbi:MAG: isoprenylcysteine carboxylmethyltransferase family protein [Deltaproteobacteria bacterium]|nr:MAG: isoprenylcysteine carboxylmethyltransferase family protein [Deltaproteobacteria bacterium]